MKIDEGFVRRRFDAPASTNNTGSGKSFGADYTKKRLVQPNSVGVEMSIAIMACGKMVFSCVDYKS